MEAIAALENQGNSVSVLLNQELVGENFWPKLLITNIFSFLMLITLHRVWCRPETIKLKTAVTRLKC